MVVVIVVVDGVGDRWIFIDGPYLSIRNSQLVIP